MEYLSLFLSMRKLKTIKIIHIFLYLLITSNSLILELKQISIPYLSLHENNSESGLRSLSEQYIYGSAFKLNYYYSNLYLGEDMQKQGYILDTGSTITSSTCVPLCVHCGKHINPAYNISSKDKILSCSDDKCRLVSSKCNSNDNKCSFSISYSEGSSLKGVFINELVRFGHNYKQQNGTFVPMGCTIDENHLFYTQDANGIMGLANNNYNFIDILYKSGAIDNKIFSLCFAQMGGIFNIGEINYRTHKENISYVPMLLDRGKYFGLSIKSMAVNNRTIETYKQYNFNIFIDSGTTISYINYKIFDEILTLMKEDCKKFDKINACGRYLYHGDFGHCFYFNSIEELNYAVYNYWPIIHFYLDGYDYKWRGPNYCFNISTSTKFGACMGINKSYGTKITLGSSWIIGHDIIFDRDNQLIGIAEAECYQNKNVNMSNGLEVEVEEVEDIKNVTFNKSWNENVTFNKSWNENLTFNTNLIESWNENETFKNNISNNNITFNHYYKALKSINIFFIYFTILIIIIIILLASIIFLIKYINQKNNNYNSESKNETNKIDFSKNNADSKYIDVSNNNLKESNTLDIV